MAENIENKLQKAKFSVKDGIRVHIYDYIVAIIILTIVMACLNAFGLTDWGDNPKEAMYKFVVEWAPYFMASLLLDGTLYKKGIFVGKSTESFKNMDTEYSKLVSSLSGEQIKGLYDFCDKYNDDALVSIQTNILRNTGLTYEEFALNGKESLCILSRRQLRQLGYTRVQIRSIMKAMRAKIHGISVNELMSSLSVKDPTNIGKNAEQLTKLHTLKATLKYFISTFLLAFIALKDIAAWGWAGLIIVVFKVGYIFARCYTSYFNGYDDITVRLNSSIGRKIDIIKMYIECK